MYSGTSLSFARIFRSLYICCLQCFSVFEFCILSADFENTHFDFPISLLLDHSGFILFGIIFSSFVSGISKFPISIFPICFYDPFRKYCFRFLTFFCPSNCFLRISLKVVGRKFLSVAFSNQLSYFLPPSSKTWPSIWSIAIPIWRVGPSPLRQ